MGRDAVYSGEQRPTYGWNVLSPSTIRIYNTARRPVPKTIIRNMEVLREISSVCCYI